MADCGGPDRCVNDLCRGMAWGICGQASAEVFEDLFVVGPGEWGEEEPEPTTEELCEASGHSYAGDDGDHGRCYCGTRTYPAGGPPMAEEVRIAGALELTEEPF